AMLWIMNAQPVFTPLGNAVEDNLNLVGSFDPSDGLLTKEFSFGNAIFQTKEKRDASVPGKIHEQVAFTVNAAKGSRIRIMNIGPVYSQGILLPPGAYDIEVTQPNGKRTREWVTIPNTGSRFEVS